MTEVFQSTLELLADKQAQGHKQLKEELAAMRGNLKQAMDKGLTPDDMSVARALAVAVDAADVAVEKIYQKVSGQGG